jgi:hypothetical protein
MHSLNHTIAVQPRVSSPTYLNTIHVQIHTYISLTTLQPPTMRLLTNTHMMIHTHIHTYIRYHVTATYDGSTMRLFTNGLLTTSSEAQSGPIRYPVSATFSIGAHVDKPYIYALRGALDDIALWNRAVAADAVAAMYATQRGSSYFCCPTSCPDGMVSTGLCVGDVSVDCKPAYPCPKCSAGMFTYITTCKQAHIHT